MGINGNSIPRSRWSAFGILEIATGVNVLFVIVRVRWMNLEDYQHKQVHSRKFWTWCTFNFKWLRWEHAIVITPSTRKEYLIHISDIYPSKRARRNIIQKYRKNTSEEKVIERFWENYLPY